MTAAATQRIANLEGRWVQYAEAAAHPKAQSAVKLVVQLSGCPSSRRPSPSCCQPRSRSRSSTICARSSSWPTWARRLVVLQEGTTSPCRAGDGRRPRWRRRSTRSSTAAALVATSPRRSSPSSSPRRTSRCSTRHWNSARSRRAVDANRRRSPRLRPRRVAAALSNATQAQVEAMAVARQRRRRAAARAGARRRRAAADGGGRRLHAGDGRGRGARREVVRAAQRPGRSGGSTRGGDERF